MKAIYIFTPDYVWEKITKGVEQHNKSKIHRIFFGEFTKERPMDLIKIFEARYFSRKRIIYSQEERKLLKRPRTYFKH